MVAPKRGDLLFNWSCEARGLPKQKVAIFFSVPKKWSKSEGFNFSIQHLQFSLDHSFKKVQMRRASPPGVVPLEHEPWVVQYWSLRSGVLSGWANSVLMHPSFYMIWYIYIYWYIDILIWWYGNKKRFSISQWSTKISKQKLHNGDVFFWGLGTAATPRDIVWTVRTGGVAIRTFRSKDLYFGVYTQFPISMEH